MKKLKLQDINAILQIAFEDSRGQTMSIENEMSARVLRSFFECCLGRMNNPESPSGIPDNSEDVVRFIGIAIARERELNSKRIWSEEIRVHAEEKLVDMAARMKRDIV